MSDPNFIFDFPLKAAAAVGAEILILLATPDGKRRVCGSKKMTEAFVAGELKPSFDDVLVKPEEAPSSFKETKLFESIPSSSVEDSASPFVSLDSSDSVPLLISQSVDESDAFQSNRPIENVSPSVLDLVSQVDLVKDAQLEIFRPKCVEDENLVFQVAAEANAVKPEGATEVNLLELDCDAEMNSVELLPDPGSGGIIASSDLNIVKIEHSDDVHILETDDCSSEVEVIEMHCPKEVELIEIDDVVATSSETNEIQEAVIEGGSIETNHFPRFTRTKNFRSLILPSEIQAFDLAWATIQIISNPTTAFSDGSLENTSLRTVMSTFGKAHARLCPCPSSTTKEFENNFFFSLVELFSMMHRLNSIDCRPFLAEGKNMAKIVSQIKEFRYMARMARLAFLAEANVSKTPGKKILPFEHICAKKKKRHF